MLLLFLHILTFSIASSHLTCFCSHWLLLWVKASGAEMATFQWMICCSKKNGDSSSVNHNHCFGHSILTKVHLLVIGIVAVFCFCDIVSHDHIIVSVIYIFLWFILRTIRTSANFASSRFFLVTAPGESKYFLWGEQNCCNEYKQASYTTKE